MKTEKATGKTTAKSAAAKVETAPEKETVVKKAAVKTETRHQQQVIQQQRKL